MSAYKNFRFISYGCANIENNNRPERDITLKIYLIRVLTITNLFFFSPLQNAPNFQQKNFPFFPSQEKQNSDVIDWTLAKQ